MLSREVTTKTGTALATSVLENNPMDRVLQCGGLEENRNLGAAGAIVTTRAEMELILSPEECAPQVLINSNKRANSRVGLSVLRYSLG